jgi:hypothetical protein
LVDEMNAVLAAERLRLDGRPKDALHHLAPYIGEQSRLQVRVSALQAARDAGDTLGVAQHAGWLRDKAGLAYAEVECSYCLQALNVLDVRRIAGDPATLPPAAARGRP